jgi:hypothetical protein
MDIWALHSTIYRRVGDTGLVPNLQEIHGWVGDAARADELLSEMAGQHLLVLDADGEVHMAHPFAATDSGYRVHGTDVSWLANCAWDSLAIPAALGIDTRIEAEWLDTGGPVDLGVVGGRLTATEGFVHYGVSAGEWWDDITET